jgi:hypothetical protein
MNNQFRNSEVVDVFEVFNVVENVEFNGYEFSKSVGAKLPVFTLKEPTVEEWNRKAKIQNTKMFVQILKRQPKNYQEVLTWIHSFIPDNKENHLAGNETDFA